MLRNLINAGLLLAFSSYANAQFPGSGSGGNPYTSSNNPYTNGNSGDSPFGAGGFLSNINRTIVIHAVLATLAFGFLFPVGGILIRVASFRGLWLFHGLWQVAAYIIFIAAAGFGVYLATHIPVQYTGINAFHQAHPIIGLVLLAVIFLQPFLGFIHHYAFRKHNRRVFWSYAHIWIGRIVLTLGIINGGLGLQLSQRIGQFAPPQGAIIGYAVGAGIMWLLYVLSVIYGESKRRRTRYDAHEVGTAPPPYRRERGYEKARRYDSRENVQYA